jgi:prephenate dehydrogenase
MPAETGPIKTVAIFGTGLIGASVGLALRKHGFAGEIIGWDKDHSQLRIAFERSAISAIAEDPLQGAQVADVIVLAGPVFSILEWIERLAPILQPHQLVTDVGSVKQPMVYRARVLYGQPGQPGFLPGHPMAGKEVFGAEHSDAELFQNAVWLFTPDHEAHPHPLAAVWRSWVEKFGARTLDLEAARHDELCAWVSHMPQMLATALSALYEDTFGDAADMRAIGGRALREMTRLGASPYSMWRDIAHTNAAAISESIAALEQRLAHLREHLKTPELRDEFLLANEFRGKYSR